MVRERLAAGRLPGDEEHLTDRCFRGGDPNTRTNRGLGLGLAFVRDVVAAHDGELESRASRDGLVVHDHPAPVPPGLVLPGSDASPSPTIPVT